MKGGIETWKVRWGDTEWREDEEAPGERGAIYGLPLLPSFSRVGPLDRCRRWKLS